MSGCSSKELDPYAPHETLLSITAEYQLLTHGDPYRDQPIRDTTDQHIARSTLVRLSNYESLQPDRFPLEVLVLKARAYEWLGDHRLAAELYRDAASTESELREDCIRRERLNRQIADLQSINTEDLMIEDLVNEVQRKSNLLKQFVENTEDELFKSFGMRAAENLDVTRAEILATNRLILEEGEQGAITALQQVAQTHNESSRRFEHVLRLAQFYRTLAEEEIRLHPPTSFDFNPQRALLYMDQSLDLLYRVSQADGYPEKIIAQKELDTVLSLKELTISESR